MLLREKANIDSLVNEILDRIPQDLLINGVVVDPSMGGGQFMKEVERRKRNAGKDVDFIRKTCYGYVDTLNDLNFIKYRVGLVSNYRVSNILEEDMKLTDAIVVGNPPYNIKSSSDKTIAGTSGNVTLYRKFIDKAFDLAGKNGIVAFVVPRAGIRYANEEYGIDMYSYDTSDNWEIAAGYFVNKSTVKGNASNDPILRKCLDITNSVKYRNAIGGSYDSLIEKGSISTTNGKVYGIIDIPNGTIPNCKYGYINTNPVMGPKVMFKGLESMQSYIATDEPAYVGSSCSILFNTLDEANKALLFIKNNKALKYLRKKTSEKTLGATYRLIKDFDLNQIVTGSEYPVEWNLTDKEIAFIETIGK